MSLFMNHDWERFGRWGLLAIAAFVIVLTPLAIYGLQSGLGLWPEGRV